MTYREDPVNFCQNELNETFTDDVKELMESVRDNQITIAQSANATGKTHGAARIAAWWYKCYPDGGHVYTASAPPESNLRDLLWGEMSKLFSKNPVLFKDDNLTYLKIEGNSNSFIKGVTIPTTGSSSEREAKFSGKHSSRLFFILDEGDAIPDEIYNGIESCMSGGENRMLVMFNPRKKNGAAYNLIKSGAANVVNLSALNHPNVVTGDDIIPGAVTRTKTVERIHKWCRPLIEDEPIDSTSFLLPDYLENFETGLYPKLTKGRYKIIEPSFSYMVLGKYPTAGDDSLISLEWIEKARTRWNIYVSKYGEIPPDGVSGIMGQDVADMGSDKNVSCFRYGGFVSRLVSWSGVDPVVTAIKATEHYKKRNIRICHVDATGVGAGVAPGMSKSGCRANKVIVGSAKNMKKIDIGSFKILRDQLWWEVREWLRTDDTAMLPPNNDLIEELTCITYQVDAMSIRVMQKKEMRKILKRSPDYADALCLTFAPSVSRVFISSF